MLPYPHPLQPQAAGMPPPQTYQRGSTDMQQRLAAMFPATDLQPVLDTSQAVQTVVPPPPGFANQAALMGNVPVVQPPPAPNVATASMFNAPVAAPTAHLASAASYQATAHQAVAFAGASAFDGVPRAAAPYQSGPAVGVPPSAAPVGNPTPEIPVFGQPPAGFDPLTGRKVMQATASPLVAPIQAPPVAQPHGAVPPQVLTQAQLQLPAPTSARQSTNPSAALHATSGVGAIPTNLRGGEDIAALRAEIMELRQIAYGSQLPDMVTQRQQVDESVGETVEVPVAPAPPSTAGLPTEQLLGMPRMPDGKATGAGPSPTDPSACGPLAVRMPATATNVPGHPMDARVLPGPPAPQLLPVKLDVPLTTPLPLAFGSPSCSKNGESYKTPDGRTMMHFCDPCRWACVANPAYLATSVSSGASSIGTGYSALGSAAGTDGATVSQASLPASYHSGALPPAAVAQQQEAPQPQTRQQMLYSFIEWRKQCGVPEVEDVQNVFHNETALFERYMQHQVSLNMTQVRFYFFVCFLSNFFLTDADVLWEPFNEWHRIGSEYTPACPRGSIHSDTR